MPGRVHRADEVRDALVLRRVGIGAGDEDAELRVLGERRPDLLAVHDPLVAVAHGAGAERGQVGARAGLAEELAPDLLGGQQREQVALLLRLDAAVDDRRARPSRCRSCSTGGARRPPTAPRRSGSGGSGRRRGPTASASAARRSRPRPAGGPSATGWRPATRARRGGADRRPPAARSPPRQRSPLLDRAVKTVGSPAVLHAELEGEPMPGWNFADVWEVVAEQVPDATAQVQGDRRITWRDFDRRANGIAQAFLDAGVEEQDKVAQYLYNGPEYLESVYATFKAGLAPINTNYRYLDDELVYLWDNGDVVAVVFHGTFAERIEGIRDRAARASSSGSGSTTAAAPAPSGPRPTRPPPRPAPPTPVPRPVGPRRRPPAPALHRRHHRHAQGRDVAPGRPVPDPRRHVHPGGARRRARPRRSSATP